MYVPWHEGVWRSGCKALRIPNSGIRWRRIVTFTFRLIFPQGNIPPYIFGKNTVGRMDCLETFLDEITCSKNWANKTVITSRKRGLARHVARTGKMINAYDVGREHLLLLTLLRSGIAQGAPSTATLLPVRRKPRCRLEAILDGRIILKTVFKEKCVKVGALFN
jgi:hypothetical protein